jgi:hypothetical protein
MVFDFFCSLLLKLCNRLRFRIRQQKAVCFCCGVEYFALSDQGRCPCCRSRMKTFLYKEKKL